MAEQLLLEVEGMHCQGCVNAVRRAVLENNEGVREVDIDLGTGRVAVSFEPGKTDAGSIVKAISAAGYKASIRN
ncbi:MAG: heavy-metal-associated domain-containing protein [Candidatus Glassbacteria bacterium]